jgi:hypothetical protein
MPEDVLAALRLYWPALAGAIAIAATIAVRRRAKRLDAEGESPAIELELGLVRLPIRVKRSVFLYGICAAALLWFAIVAITRDYARFFPSLLRMEVFYDREGIQATLDALSPHDRDELHVAPRWAEARDSYYQGLDRELRTALPDVTPFFGGGDSAVHSAGETTFIVKKVSGWQRYHIDDSQGELLHTLELPNRPPRQLLTAFVKLNTSDDYLAPSFSDLVVRRAFVMRPRFKQYFGASKVALGTPFKVAIIAVTRVTVFPLPDFSNTLYLAKVEGTGLVPIAYAVYQPANRSPSAEE